MKQKQISKIGKLYNIAIDNQLHWYMLFSLIIGFVWFGYTEEILKLYDEFVIPVLSQFKSSWWSVALVLLSACFVAVDIMHKYKNKYQYNPVLMFVLAWMVLIASIVHYSSLYIYVCFWGIVPYFDLLVLEAIAYIAFAILNAVRNQKEREKRENEENEKHALSERILLKDWPIDTEKDDIFYFSDETAKIVKEMGLLDRNKTWSLAITAPWGAGKTSFINLIIEKLDSKLFDIIYFNPRDCKSYDKIQEDFFNALGCLLGKYNSKFDGTLKKYMASLLLIDKRGFFEKILNLYHIWNKEDIKNDLKEAFAILPKRILVVIDDYDRLSKEEIMEVLKLIDSNAAFSNLVFLTAYDKKQVNKALGDDNRTDDACFVDKFFNLEFSIPARHYTYILKYLRETLTNVLKAENDEKKEIEDAINSNHDIFRQYLPTLRDTKRYINQVVLDYKEVREEVEVKEFLLVQVIKYRELAYYKRLFHQEFLFQSYFDFGHNILCIKDDIDKNISVLPILKKIFPDSKSEKDSISSFRHIYNPMSFNNYFVNSIFEALKIKDMKKIFEKKDIEKVYSVIDEWLSDDCKTVDLIEYLSTFQIGSFNDVDSFFRYSDIVTYTAVKIPDSQIFWSFIRFLYESNFEDCKYKDKLKTEDYKSRLLTIITEKSYDKQLRLAIGLFRQLRLGSIHQDGSIIKDTDLWEYIVNGLKSALINDADEKEMIYWLYSCIDSVEDNTRKIILNKECTDLYRKHIEKSPKNYLNNFVRLGMVSLDPEFNAIACEPFCAQIFGDNYAVERFLNDCKEKGVEKAELCCSFWKLYKANEYQMIEYHNQGNVQEKIDKGLVDEIKMLEELEAINKEVDGISNTVEGMDNETKQKNKQKLEKCNERLNNVRLYITLHGHIRKKIYSLKSVYGL